MEVQRRLWGALYLLGKKVWTIAKIDRAMDGGDETEKKKKQNLDKCKKTQGGAEEKHGTNCLTNNKGGLMG